MQAKSKTRLGERSKISRDCQQEKNHALKLVSIFQKQNPKCLHPEIITTYQHMALRSTEKTQIFNFPP